MKETITIKLVLLKCFAPIARKQINVIDSEISNALFSREDYFKVKPTEETEERSLKDSHIAYKVIKTFRSRGLCFKLRYFS